MSKRPSFQFYPADWIKDPNLRRCTKAEKGVWIDMLCLMHECEDYGVLISDGVAWTDLEIAGAVGGDITENLSCISELLRKGVAHRQADNAIFSRRMKRDEHKRKLCSIAGQKGGNPNIINRNLRSSSGEIVPTAKAINPSSPCGSRASPTLKGVSKGDIKGSSKGASKPNPTPSSSSSSSKKEEDIKSISSSPLNPPKGRDQGDEAFQIVIPPWLAERDWLAFLEHRKQLRAPMGLIAQQRGIEKLAKLRKQGFDVASVIDQSIVNGWKGLFPVNNFQEGKLNGNSGNGSAGGYIEQLKRAGQIAFGSRDVPEVQDNLGEKVE